MKFGNYNINTVSSSKSKNRKLDVFRFTKLKTTTNNFVGRFHNKIAGSSFRKLNASTASTRSESPLSYCASLFDRDAISDNVNNKFSPKDFPNYHHFAINDNNNYYVFRNKIRNISSTNHKNLSGKNHFVKQNIYSTLCTTDEQKNISANQSNAVSTKKTHRVKRQNSTLKDILDSASGIDEEFEFRILKDYFDTNSYSDIVKDNDFKNYLNKKNYGDILDYLKSDSSSNSSGINSNCEWSKKNQIHIFDENEKLKTFDGGKLIKSKSTGNLYESINSCDSMISGDEPAGCTANILGPQSGWCNSLKRLKNVFSLTMPRSNNNSDKHRYDYVKKTCEHCLADTNATLYNQKVPTFVPDANYTDKGYRKIIFNFVRSKGFDNVKSYVYHKYGSMLSAESLLYNDTIPDRRDNKKSKKNYIQNIEKRYYQTKQTILDADFIRTNYKNWSANPKLVYDDDDVIPNNNNNNNAYTQLEFNCNSTIENKKSKNRTYHEFYLDECYYNGKYSHLDNAHLNENSYNNKNNSNYVHNWGSSNDDSYIKYVKKKIMLIVLSFFYRCTIVHLLKPINISLLFNILELEWQCFYVLKN